MSGASDLRPFDLALAAALREAWPGMPPGVDRLVAQLSLAVADGHSCLPLDGDAAAALSAWSAVGRGEADRPLVLDAGGRLYLRRYWGYESRVARQLAARAREETASPATAALVDAVLTRWLPHADPTQRDAAACALTRRLAVILGGPGTGKTWTLIRIIAALADLAERTGRDPPRIALAATTGKAAQRLAEMAASAFAPDSALALAPAAIPRATTVHRLLGMRRDSTRARFDRDEPLPHDVVIVDEASMLDLPMLAHLVDALSPTARLVLVGDPDQLASVEAGSVLAELRRVRQAEPDGTIGRGVVTLRRGHRFDGADALSAALDAVRAGDVEALFAALRDTAVVEWHETLPAQPARAVAEHPRLAQAGRAGDTAQRLLAQAQTRALVALRAGPFGVDAVNAACRRVRGGRRDGEPVLVLANAPALRLSNGDVGVYEDGEEAGVWFADAAGALRRLPVAELPAHEAAYAMTVHKAQGSEFGHVLVLLPSPAHELVTREWLYTALSRARRGVTLWATRDALRAAVERPARRYSGLRDRLLAP